MVPRLRNRDDQLWTKMQSRFKTGFNAVFDQWRTSTDVEILVDEVTRALYATDASVFQEQPTAVAFPKTDKHIADLIRLAIESGVGLIPRTAGTSLAGQVVGDGIVVDVSRHMNRILEINTSQQWVRVQPGVIRDELNLELQTSGLMFAPETSTSNRAMIGGMLGNNSCGANSIVYGTTRDHVLAVTGFLSDGSQACFDSLTVEDYAAKTDIANSTLEANIYRGVHELLCDPQTRAEITREFPKPTIHRRNTGYAVDALMNCDLFGVSTEPFNMCQLIAGSEGTLFFATEIKLQLQPLPPPKFNLICAHFDSVEDALRATQLAMQFKPFACELIDHLILEGAARNLEQQENIGFVQGNPGAILVIEVRGENDDDVAAKRKQLIATFEGEDVGYAFPVLTKDESPKVWSLRKAGLGIVNNIPGDEKPVAIIEDAAVDVQDLPNYIREVNRHLKENFNVECVNYGHAGAGEIHLRPVLNLKTSEGLNDFKQIANDIAKIVKRYQGSLSGEHGDGRLRSEFLQTMIGPKNLELLKQIKQLWDPNNIFNPGKIVDAPPMTTSLRYQSDHQPSEHDTVLDFSATNGMLRAVEMCNGSGDCRKTHLAGGTMCPSFMATRNEADTTRARANLLRQAMTGETDANIDDHDVLQILDLCMSCKGCKRECPSNVDMSKIKAEFTQRYFDQHGTPRRSRLIANLNRFNRFARKATWLSNAITSNGLIKNLLGFSKQRELPRLSKATFRDWFAKHIAHKNAGDRGEVNFFADEFMNYYDVHLGIATVELLERLGWKVDLPQHTESGRVQISQGLLRRAKTIAERNVASLSPLVAATKPLIGIEPSAILTFRDEYPDLLRGKLKEEAERLAANTFMIDEFIDHAELEPSLFTQDEKVIRLHGHCHQKAIASLASTIRILQLPHNYTVRTIPSGCCGMAGSFGYEKEHYELSMQIGELVLFPVVRNEPKENLIAASGTSCRHQIFDGTNRKALHPVEILHGALKE